MYNSKKDNEEKEGDKKHAHEMTEETKQKAARREAARAAEERKKIWSWAVAPASKLVADLVTKGDLPPIAVSPKFLTPNVNWMQPKQAKEIKVALKEVEEEPHQIFEFKYNENVTYGDDYEDNDDDDSDEETEKGEEYEKDEDSYQYEIPPSVEKEEEQRVKEKLDAEDELDDGLDEFRGIFKKKSSTKTPVKRRPPPGPKFAAPDTTLNKDTTKQESKGNRAPDPPSEPQKLKTKASVVATSHSKMDIDDEGESSHGRRSSVGISEGRGSGTGEEDSSSNNDENEDFRKKTDEKRPLYEMAQIDVRPDEAMQDLEDLLDDMQLEARVTERYKHKLLNKFGLFLQALITFQEREVEMIETIDTKWKIMDALEEFVKTENELAAKTVVAEEKHEVEDHEDTLILDLESKVPREETNENEDPGGSKSQQRTSHGLSIDEMSAKIMRETLLQQRNRLEIQEDMRRIQILEGKQLEFEKTLLSLHYSRMIKPVDLQREMKESRRQVNDLENEISQIQQEMSQLQTDMAVEEKAIYDEEKNVEKMELDALTKQNEVQQNANKPVHLSKEADREAHKFEQLDDQILQMNMKFMDDFEEMRILQSKIDKVLSELNALGKEEYNMQRRRKNSFHETENLLSQMEALVGKEQNLLERAATMTDKIGHTNKIKKKLQEELHHTSNEANKAHRESQRLERNIRMSNEMYLNAKLAYEKMKSAFEATKPKSDSSSWDRLNRMLQREINNLKVSLNKKLAEASIKASVVERLQIELSELYEGQITAGKELQDLIRTTVRKRYEREEKSEQCIKLEQQITKLLQDKKMQDIILEDLLRAEADYKAQVKQLVEDGRKAKLAKAAMISDIVSTRDKLTAAEEKKIGLEKEVETASINIKEREQQLGEMYFVTLNTVLSRNSERNTALRHRDKFRAYRIEKSEILLNTKTLRREVEKQKEEVIAIRKEYEQHHNASCRKAIKVRERIEEICTFTENIKLYDMILLRGQSAIGVREVEKIKLNSLYEETRKHMLIVKMNKPDETSIINQIEYLRNVFYNTTEERRALERRLNDDDSPELVREINFDLMEKKETVALLEKRLDRAEEELATKDALALERSLIDEQLDENLDKFIQQAQYLKDTYADDVKVLVNLRKALAMISRRIDGMICETSIAIAQADSAEKQYLELKQLVETAETNYENGLTPNKDLEEEWNHLQWRKKMLTRSRAQKKEFLTKAKRLTGSQIIMERMRPKPKKNADCGNPPYQRDLSEKFPCSNGIKPTHITIKKVKHTTGIGQCFLVNCKK